VSTNGVLVLTNFYDEKSRRVKKVTADAVITFFYDDWNLVEERIVYTNGAMSTIHYCWGTDLSGTLHGAGGVGGLLYLTVDDEIYIPCYDNNGNITQYIDVNGYSVASYAYDSFGGIITKSGPLADFFRHSFSTKYFDTETCLYYYGYRFYRPDHGRWLNRDPIDEDGGVNLYTLCENNPKIKFDINGQSWLYCFGDCVEEWRLDWSKVFTIINILSSANAPVPKIDSEKLWLDKGVSKNTTELSRAISQGERLARRLPLGSPIRSKIVQSLGDLRRFMRNPTLVKAGAAGSVLTVFEGFYDIGTMLYCSIHCCGR
jgi:RHS repeat-associated protein